MGPKTYQQCAGFIRINPQTRCAHKYVQTHGNKHITYIYYCVYNWITNSTELSVSRLQWVRILFSFFVFLFFFLNSAISSLPQVPENPAAKKGKGKACVRVSTSFNPLDQTCIHPESYHVAQRYRTHNPNMHFQESSCILSYRSTYLPVFVIFTCNQLNCSLMQH